MRYTWTWWVLGMEGYILMLVAPSQANQRQARQKRVPQDDQFHARSPTAIVPLPPCAEKQSVSYQIPWHLLPRVHTSDLMVFCCVYMFKLNMGRNPPGKKHVLKTPDHNPKIVQEHRTIALRLNRYASIALPVLQSRRPLRAASD